MLNKLNFSYNHEKSIIHLINPLIKLIGLFVYVLVCFLKYDFILVICNIGFVFLLMLLSNISFKRYLAILFYLLFFFIPFYLFLGNYMGLSLGRIHIIAFEILFFIYYLFLIIYTTSKEDLGKSNSTIVDRVNFISFPVKKIGMFFTNLYAYVIICIESFNSIIMKLEQAGNDYVNSYIIKKGLLVAENKKKISKLSKEIKDQRKKDMKYRMFNDKIKSKYKYANKLNVFDYVYLVYIIGLIFVYVIKVR